MKIAIRISCRTKRVCRTEKYSIEAIRMLPMPSVVPMTVMSSTPPTSSSVFTSASKKAGSVRKKR